MGIAARMLAVQEQIRDAATGTSQVRFQFDSLADGTALADFSNGASATPGYDVTETGYIRWNDNATSTAITGPSVVLPRNFDGTRDATLYIAAAKVGATLADAATFDVTLFAVKSGDALDADTNFGVTTSAMTGNATTKTIQTVSVTLGAGDLPDSGPVFLTLSIKPTDGVLSADDLVLVDVWLEYRTTAV